MRSRKKILEARDAAKAFIKAVNAWEKKYPYPTGLANEPHLENVTPKQIEVIADGRGFGNRHSGELKAASLILTRRLADMRR